MKRFRFLTSLTKLATIVLRSCLCFTTLALAAPLASSPVTVGENTFASLKSCNDSIAALPCRIVIKKSAIRVQPKLHTIRARFRISPAYDGVRHEWRTLKLTELRGLISSTPLTNGIFAYGTAKEVQKKIDQVTTENVAIKLYADRPMERIKNKRALTRAALAEFVDDLGSRDRVKKTKSRIGQWGGGIFLLLMVLALLARWRTRRSQASKS